MIPTELRESLERQLTHAVSPPELAVDVMMALQGYYGYLSDEALEEAAGILGMSTLELEGLATFYDFIHRRPVGKYLITVCDSVVCWLHGHESIVDYLSQALGIQMGQTTSDGLFTLLPTSCIGACDRAPAMLVNGELLGPLTPAKLDEILKSLKDRASALPGR